MVSHQVRFNIMEGKTGENQNENIDLICLSKNQCKYKSWSVDLKWTFLILFVSIVVVR